MLKAPNPIPENTLETKVTVANDSQPTVLPPVLPRVKRPRIKRP